MRQHRTHHDDRHTVHVAGMHRIGDVAHQTAQPQFRQYHLHQAGEHDAERGVGEQQRQEGPAVGAEEARVFDQPAEQTGHQQCQRGARAAEHRSAAAGDRRGDARDRGGARPEHETERGLFRA